MFLYNGWNLLLFGWSFTLFFYLFIFFFTEQLSLKNSLQVLSWVWHSIVHDGEAGKCGAFLLFPLIPGPLYFRLVEPVGVSNRSVWEVVKNDSELPFLMILKLQLNMNSLLVWDDCEVNLFLLTV